MKIYESIDDLNRMVRWSATTETSPGIVQTHTTSYLGARREMQSAEIEMGLGDEVKDYKMNGFNRQQIDRLALEKRLKFLAARWQDVTHKKMRENIDIEAKNDVMRYISQIPAMDYHMKRYGRLKQSKI